MAIKISESDKINLVKKIILCAHCGERHIDKDKFVTFDHRKHLCQFCDKYFYDGVWAVGVEEI